MAEQPKVVLAYSGGLDTSYCIKYFTEEKGWAVYTVLVDTGGFDAEELTRIEQKAYQLGATQFTCISKTRQYYEQCLRYLVYGNILKNNTYPLSVSAERVFQAMAVAEYARNLGADYVAHGSTGAGNDQVRFDMIFHIEIPHIPVITPIRDNKLSRQQEIEFLKSKGVDMEWHKAEYSVNKGLWGTSVGGKETLTSHSYLPEDAFPTPLSASENKLVTLHFEKGELKGVDGKSYEHPVEAIQALQQIAGAYAIGRDIHVGDTIIGIKGRVGFEAAAPILTIKAHHLLEKHVLTKWQQYWKDQLATWYGNLLHEGQFLDPVMRNIEHFMEDTQNHVTGVVTAELTPYCFTLQGITSEYDLMSSAFGQYGEMNNAWSGEDVRGFSKILSNQTMIYHQIAKQHEQD
jgi:argininosuccinate synthase